MIWRLFTLSFSPTQITVHLHLLPSKFFSHRTHGMLSRKRTSKSNAPFVPPFAHPQPNKLLKPTPIAAQPEPASSRASVEPRTTPPPRSQSSTDEMVSVLADAGCTLIIPVGPPCLPSDLYSFRQRLDGILSDDSSLRSHFLKGFSDYISSTSNLRRVLLPCHRDGFGSMRSESLVRLLLLVKSIQQDFLDMLLEKLPEYFDTNPLVGACRIPSSPRFDDDVARLILNQFRWLDFLVDSEAFTGKLLQVLSICPHHLKKEIIGSLPEIIGDQNNKTVVSSLQQMLQEDSSIIVPVLDSLSNLNSDDLLQDQVIMIAISCIRTINIEHMPYLLRFLLLSAKASNARRIFSHIREQLKFVGASHARALQNSKLKEKSIVDSTKASILDALRSSLRFKNMLCLELLKEMKSLEEACDHKVIDIWLLTLIFMNSESLQKGVEKLFKKKVIEGCFQDHMFDQCIHGIKDLPQDYLPTFLSLSAYLLACKEQRAQEFGIHMYICLFEEYSDAYSRQEVLGALLTHVGSGICYEVSAALDAMVILASKKSPDLISLSSHITGILDYLEGFNVDSLHKVYEVFVRLAVSAQSSRQPYGCSIANELLMILRKQINNSDLMYKKMGLIGTLKIVSYIADINNTSLPSLSQRSNYDEAVELLNISLDSCKQLPLPLILFYEELVSTLQSKTLHSTIMEWVGKKVGEFESIYLFDLDSGNLIGKDFSHGLEGELWMNLDGDISPICLNILPLVRSSSRFASPLQVLPTKFVLLSVVERLTNQGSLRGIDALLGCPFHLPSPKLFSQPSWQSLTAKQKHIAVLCLYYAANWMRELLNAFSTQVVEGCDAESQATKQEIILKLLKRLRNLVFVEFLLDNCLKQHPILLPELYPQLELSPVIELDYMGDLEKISQRVKWSDCTSQNKKRNRAKLSSSANSNIEEKPWQPTIVDLWRKAGAIPNQEALKEDLSMMSSTTGQPESAGTHADNSNIQQNIEISAPAKCLEAQKYKFRPLSVDCLSIFACLENNRDSCCADPSAELPLHLYLLRDLHKKLDQLSPTRRQILARCLNAPAGLMGMRVNDFLRRIQLLFPYLRRNFDRAVCILREGAETCQEHWTTQSSLAANPEIINRSISASPALTSISVFKETLLCFGKMLNLPDLLNEKTILSDLLHAFQPMEISSSFFQRMQLIPSVGNMDYLYSGAYIFLGGVLDMAMNFSFTLASEVLLTLESMITSMRMFLNRSPYEKGKDSCAGSSKEIIPFLCNKLGNCAQKLLMHKCDRDDVDGSLKTKGEMVQRILRIYLGNCQSTSDSLIELACSILRQVSSSQTSVEDDNQPFLSLCPATMVVWYRVMHEENISALNSLVKESALLEKPKGGGNVENVQRLLNKILQSVNVVVSLTNMCRNSEKVSVRAMAVKYGGKFIDSFLKVFDFLRAQFQMHKDLILHLIKELQKATRTIQTLCSEAKGSKQTAITGKIPATKRSMERFLFHVKALLYTTPSGCSFWMGNLKHKDLMGQVVSSQAYLDDQNDEINNDPAEACSDDQHQNDEINNDPAEAAVEDRP